MAWFLLAIAIASEVVGTLCLKASESFTKVWPSVGVLVGYLVAFVLMGKTVQRIDVGITYAIWSAFGIVGAAVGGRFLFGETITAMAAAGMGIIVLGVVLVFAGGAGH